MATLRECTFALLRRELARELNIREDEIVPESPVARLIPLHRRPALWQACQSHLGLALPDLELSPAMARTGHLLSFGSALRAGAIGLLFGAKWLALPLAIAALVVFAVLYRVLTSPWRTELSGIETFDDLTRAVLARNMPACRELFDLPPTPDEIYSVVAHLLEEVGADPAQITRETPLAELLE